MNEINIKYFYSKVENNIQTDKKTFFIIQNIKINNLTCKYLQYLLKNDKVNIEYIQKIKLKNDNNNYDDLTDKSLTNWIKNAKNNELNLVLILSPQNKTTANNDYKLMKYLEILDQLDDLKKSIKNIYYNSKTSDLALKKRNTFILESKENYETLTNYDLFYLYSNPLIVIKSNNKKIYDNMNDNNEEIKDNEHLNNIKNIYNIFLTKKIKYNLEFNILYENDLKNYLQKSPKILHISTDSEILNLNGQQKLCLTVEKKNLVKSELTEDLIIQAIKAAPNSKNILLLIINTPNSIKMGKIFYDNGIKNVLCIENKNNYPFSNEFSENFICLFYSELIEENSIKNSFLNVKKKLLKTKEDLNNLIKLYGEGEYIIFDNNKKENLKIDKSKSFKKINNFNIINEKKDNINIINKNNSNELELIPKSSKELLNIKRINYLELKRENSNSEFKIISGNPLINHNCILNCKFEIEGQFRIIAQNKNIQSILINFTEKKDKIVFVIGEKGMGKCLIIKKIGKILFERKIFNEVIFFEIKNFINENNIIDENNIIKNINNKKINKDSKENCLILINYKNIINDEKNIINDERNIIILLKEKIDKILENNENYYFLISLSTKENLNSSFNYFKVGSLKDEQRFLLFDYLKKYDNNLKNKLIKNQIYKKNWEKIIKSSNGKINEIFLRINFLLLYFEYIMKNISNLNFTTTEIFSKMLKDEKTKNLNQKLFCLFFLLIEGVSINELNFFLNENEKMELNENYKFIIQKYYYKPIHNYIYKIDDSFLFRFKSFLDKNVIINLLKSILKYYHKIFYKIIINYNYLYDLINEKTNKIGVAFCLNFNILDKNYEENKNEKDLIFMDYYLYNFENIIKNFDEPYLKCIFEENNKISTPQTPNNSLNIFETLDENNIYKNYFSQISIFLLTIIYKRNEDSKNLIECLNNISIKFKINILYLNLLIFNYLTSQKSSNEIKILDILNYRKVEGEISLIKIINYFKTCSGENLDDCYKKAKKIFINQNDSYKLFKLNFLMGKINKNFDKCLEYYDYCIENAKFCLNYNFLVIKIFIAKGYFHLKHNNFSQATEFAEKAKKLYDEIENNKKDFLLKEINELFIDINDENKKKTQNLLIFLEANQILSSDNNEINSIMNSAYNLKMELKNRLKNNEINFKIFNINEFESFNKYFNYSGNFLYINSDEFDEDGNLYIEDKYGKSIKKDIDDLIKIIKDKNKTYDLVILGFFNSEKLYSNLKFPRVIYFPYNRDLLNLFKENPNIMIFFKENFYSFIIDLLSQLSKKIKLKTSFNNAKYQFLQKIDVIPNIKKYCESKEFIELYVDQNESDDFVIINEKNYSRISNELSNSNIINNNIYDEYNYNNTKTYGRKKEFYEIFQLIYNNNCVNLYGESKAGKTQIAFELCKFCKLRNFYENIHYINFQNKSRNFTKNQILKELKEKINKTNVFVVIDDIDKIKIIKSILSISSEIHFLFISKEKINFLPNCEYYKLNSKLEYKKAKDFFIFFHYEKKIFTDLEKYINEFFIDKDKEYKINDIINYINKNNN